MKGLFVTVRDFKIGSSPWSGEVVSDPFMDKDGTFWVLVKRSEEVFKVDTDTIRKIGRKRQQFSNPKEVVNDTKESQDNDDPANA